MGVQFWIRTRNTRKGLEIFREFNPKLTGITLVVDVSTDLIEQVEEVIRANEEDIESWDWNYS